jgi:hypothetical protein
MENIHYVCMLNTECNLHCTIYTFSAQKERLTGRANEELFADIDLRSHLSGGQLRLYLALYVANCGQLLVCYGISMLHCVS